MISLVSHEYGLVVFLILVLAIALSNLRAIPVLGRKRNARPEFEKSPMRVSILVPARNEERNIGPCVQSLLAQDYPNFELIVLDDSDDGTPQVVEGLPSHRDLRVFTSKPLPIDWMGKNWACHQLAEEADGDLLLFTDADTRHAPAMLSQAVQVLQARGLDLLSVLPRQDVRTWAERLIVPILSWSLHTFFPFAVAKLTGWRFLAIAVGQVMLFRREAYDRIGGHSAVRGSVVDDRALVRQIVRHGFSWALADGADQVRVRMYTRFREVYDGLSKNLFAIFGYNLPVFAFVWAWLLWISWEPPLILLLRAAGGGVVSDALMPPAAIATGLLLVLWLINNVRFRLPIWQAIVHPITLMLVCAIAVRSVAWRYLRTGTWKGRPLQVPRAVATARNPVGQAEEDQDTEA